jgi:hypothetical protein
MIFDRLVISLREVRLNRSVGAVALAVPLLAGVAGCAQILGLSDYQEGPASTGSTGGAGGTAAQGSSTSSVGGSASASGTGTVSGPGGGAPCGDGKTQPPEECDNGAANGPQAACKADCTQNVCGDGDVGPGEICDEGAQNGLGLLKCAPDCSRTIIKKKIVISQTQPDSNLGPNPVAHADSRCPLGYKALFVFGDTRRATTIANEVKNPVDWVLAPYTYYYNAQSNPIWLTDAVALLGVRNGTFIGLENPVRPLVTEESLTGLAADWTTLGANNCNGWSKLSSDVDKSVGLTFASEITFIVNVDLASCSYSAVFYCVEQ